MSGRAKVGVGIRLDPEVIREINAAKDKVPRLTVQSIVEDGIEHVLSKLRADFNSGEKFVRIQPISQRS
jgi:hypothetical protein